MDWEVLLFLTDEEQVRILTQILNTKGIQVEAFMTRESVLDLTRRGGLDYEQKRLAVLGDSTDTTLFSTVEREKFLRALPILGIPNSRVLTFSGPQQYNLETNPITSLVMQIGEITGAGFEREQRVKLEGGRCA